MTLLARLSVFLGLRQEALAEPIAPPLFQAAPMPVHAIGDAGRDGAISPLPGRPDPSLAIPALPKPAEDFMLSFAGAARPLSQIDFIWAAAALRCDVAAVQAVRIVEAGAAGGFLADGSGRPAILYEAHRFAKETGGRFSASHPAISVPAWDRTLYKGGALEYPRLAAALALDRVGALRATSWGLFQILGANHLAAGYLDVESYVQAMTASEGAHLDAFVSFCRTHALDIHLQAQNWPGFARGYNGTAYALNRYDTKLAEAYAMAKGKAVPLPKALRIGATGQAVRDLQRGLIKAGYKVTADGIFSRATEIAVEQFQEAKGLLADGVVGPVTGSALGI
jgi:hypothetical protein